MNDKTAKTSVRQTDTAISMEEFLRDAELARQQKSFKAFIQKLEQIEAEQPRHARQPIRQLIEFITQEQGKPVIERASLAKYDKHFSEYRKAVAAELCLDSLYLIKRIQFRTISKARFLMKIEVNKFAAEGTERARKLNANVDMGRNTFEKARKQLIGVIDQMQELGDADLEKVVIEYQDWIKAELSKPVKEQPSKRELKAKYKKFYRTISKFIEAEYLDWKTRVFHSIRLCLYTIY